MRLRVELAAADGWITIEVRDRGSGFDQATVPQGGHLGSLRRRLVEVGGSVAVDSVPGEGTRVLLRTPQELT